ncbi:MAG TPA: ATP-binding protein, partial [Mycobacteriales bacterium]|nr:ATP-binding protein [Mycobacteriales bacterium]
MLVISKPSRIFDRDFEWQSLSAFASRASSRPELGVVTGRRRQGKTYLVEALARETGGFYFSATQATQAESLRLFADAIGQRLAISVPPRLTSWDDGIRYLFSNNSGITGPIVIDEFPYLVSSSPALPSILQREIDQGVADRKQISLLLCGSALSVMGRILAGNAPLRGRASLELVVRPFDYRTTAQFWQLGDPKLAALLNAVVGGTPAYRQFVGEDSPRSVADFDDWVLRTVLNPANPLFREARYLLEEDVSEVRDPALYQSVLAAVAHGNNTRGGIANYIGRKAADIGHHLNVLEDCGFIRREPDLFRSGRPRYRIADPLVAFYHVVMRPQWGLLESRRASLVWQDAQPRFSAQLLGPQFEQLCREFALSSAPEVFGSLPGEVGSGVVADPAERSQIEIDVVVMAPALPNEPRRVLSLGEVKWGETMSQRHLDRLKRARELLARHGYDVRDTVLACYSGVGFDPALPAQV